jgi:hypothetical protein
MVIEIDSGGNENSQIVILMTIPLLSNALHGVVITGLGGRCPYLSLRLLLTWHDLHVFVIDRIEACIPFQ